VAFGAVSPSNSTRSSPAGPIRGSRRSGLAVEANYTLAAMTEQTRTEADEPGARTAAPGWWAPLRRRGPRAAQSAQPAGRTVERGPLVAAVAGLLLGVLALGPGVLPGYLLSYDMVFVPSPPFNAAVLGTSGALPRAVPSDAVVAALARVIPADAVQKLILLAIFVLASAGAAWLLRRERLPAQLASGVLYAWNPFVAERLILGQWATLLGYAGLPWVLAALARPARGLRSHARLAVALLPAAVGGFAAMLISAGTAIPAALWPSDTGDPAGQTARRGVRTRLGRAAIAAAVLLALSLPWLIPAVTRHVATSTAGVAAFAARADTPFGTAGSLLMLGGGWNAQAVPAGYGGLASTGWLALAVVALGGFLLLGRRRWPGLLVAAALGLAIALLGATGPGQDLLRGLIGWWPGFAVLRDGQQYVAPLALAEALGLGLVVARVLAGGSREAGREGRRAAVVALALLPVLLLPGLAWGAAGRLRPAGYPADWIAARQLMNADPGHGKALLLPWAAYRRFGWNHDEAVLDPWPRLPDREVVWNDSVQVGSTVIPAEDPAAIALTPAIESAGPLTGLLRSNGFRYVIVDAGFGPGPGGGQPFRARLPGCQLVLSGPGLAVYRIPG
jgi:hypothetical protein